MSRLTKEITAYGKTYIECNMKSCKAWECTDCQHFKEILAKLKRYEDLEEQGRLIKLPCKFGEDAWVLCKHFMYGEVGDTAEVKWFIEKRQFNFRDYVTHRRMVYATKEEAEAKLAELKGTE